MDMHGVESQGLFLISYSLLVLVAEADWELEVVLRLGWSHVLFVYFPSFRNEIKSSLV